MASFKDLSSDAGLKELDSYLLSRSYITGYQASRDDLAVYSALSSAPKADQYVNAARWYAHITALLGSNFPGQGQGVSIGGGKAAAAASPASPKPAAKEPAAKGPASPKPATKPAPKAAAKDDEDDDDDLDLFGEETAEEKAAKEAAIDAAKKRAQKKKEAGKSSVLMDIKPWDDETDMKALEASVRKVTMEGLTWGASKLVPVGYGIKKLQIMLTIEDEKVSVDELIEDKLCEGEETKEYIQSCDIVAFNKI